MAVESPVLLHALAAFSSANLSFFDDSYANMAIESRARALSALSQSLFEASIVQQEVNLAACLILATAEISLGHRDVWPDHMRGAKHIILSASARGSYGQNLTGPEVFRKSAEGRFLLRNFVYHDVMGSIVSGSKLLLDPQHLDGIFDSVDSYLGVASDVLLLIAQVSSLDLEPHSLLSSDSSVEPSTADPILIAKIAHDLENWKCPPAAEPALRSMAYAYRSATLLYLYARVCRFPSLKAVVDSQVSGVTRGVDRVQTEVTKTLYHLSNIPLNGSPEGSLLFPMFFAGAAAVRQSDIASLRWRLTNVVKTRGFRNFRLALDVLKKIWILQASHSENMYGSQEWAELIRTEAGGLNLS